MARFALNPFCVPEPDWSAPELAYTRAIARAEQLDSDLTQARTELEEIRTISSNAVQVFQEKQRLTELNERLRDELEDLAADRERLAENLQRQWLFMGAGLIFIGLILGVLIKSRPRRSGWS